MKIKSRFFSISIIVALLTLFAASYSYAASDGSEISDKSICANLTDLASPQPLYEEMARDRELNCSSEYDFSKTSSEVKHFTTMLSSVLGIVSHFLIMLFLLDGHSM